MNVKELRRAIIECLDDAQRRSDAPVKSDIGRYYENRIVADRDRLRLFFSLLTGHLKRDDPQLSTALWTFLKAEPGAPLPLPEQLVPSSFDEEANGKQNTK